MSSWTAAAPAGSGSDGGGSSVPQRSMRRIMWPPVRDGCLAAVPVRATELTGGWERLSARLAAAADGHVARVCGGGDRAPRVVVAQDAADLDVPGVGGGVDAVLAACGDRDVDVPGVAVGVHDDRLGGELEVDVAGVGGRLDRRGVEVAPRDVAAVGGQLEVAGEPLGQDVAAVPAHDDVGVERDG